MAAYLGCMLEIETKDGTFEGVLIDLETGSKKITLNKVKVKESGKKLRTPCHFYSNEILELKVIPDKSKENTSPDKPPVASHGTTKQNGVQSHPIEEAEPPVDGMLTSMKSDRRSQERASSSRDDTVISPTEHKSAWQELKLASSQGFIMVDKIGSNFRKVVEHLKSQHFIGLAVSGVHIGRRGELHIIQIYADEVTYIFDAKSLGAAVFNYERGNLGDILESHSIVKVVHDVRWMSDLFHHRFGIQLNCVYDTQVADVLVQRHEKGGEIPRYTRALPECLLEYLEISISDVYSKMVHSKVDTAEEFLWDERPLNPDLLESAMRKVRYLLDLRVATLRRLMGELMCATKIYLSCVRDTPDTTATSRGQDPSLVPFELNKFFRRGFRGMDEMLGVYEEFQLGSVGEEDGPNSKHGSVPWDLWQPGQKLNPALHKTKRQEQFADAVHTTTNQTHTSNAVNINPSPMQSETPSEPQVNGIVSNGLPGGAEANRLSDEASDSDEEDVFGGDEDIFAWRRGPTVEGQEERTVPDKRSEPSNNRTKIAEQLDSKSYRKDQNLYKSPVLKCATDLYNLPVNRVESSSTTDDDSSPVEEETNQMAATEPIQWPSGGNQSDFVVRPAGIEEGTLFEALPSPARSNKPVSVPTTATTQDKENIYTSNTISHTVPSANNYGVKDEVSAGNESSFSSHSKYHVHNDRETIKINSNDKHTDRIVTDTHDVSEQDGESCRPKTTSNQKDRRPDRERYMPPRMREIPPRFRRSNNTNRSASNSDQYSSFSTHSNTARQNHVTNGAIESGSESSSSGSSSGSNRGQQRANQSAPMSFGEMVAQLSDRDSDASVGETANGRRTQRNGGSEKTTSSESEDLMSMYDEMVTARAAEIRGPRGRGRARAMHSPLDHQPARRRQQERVYGTPLNSNEMKMDFPSDYEIAHGPKAIPVPASLNLISVKTIGRGGMRY